MRYIALSVATLLAGVTEGAEAQIEAGQVRTLLEELQSDNLWGEAVLAGGQIRSIQVGEIAEDSVHVTEVYGALQRRQATYAVADFSALRPLGSERIQLRRAAYGRSKSMLGALLLETVVPGGGYLYIGETRQALALWGLTGVAAATAIATGEDGAAGWAPLSAWIKVASLFQLRDKVRAMNANAVAWRVDVGALAGRQGAVPALSVRVGF